MIDVGLHSLGAVFVAFALGALIGAGFGWITSPSPAPEASAGSVGSSVVHATGVTPPAQALELNITSIPSGASLYVDGVYVGRTPMHRARWVLPPTGEVPVLELRRPGFETARVALQPGDRADIQVELDVRE